MGRVVLLAWKNNGAVASHEDGLLPRFCWGKERERERRLKTSRSGDTDWPDSRENRIISVLLWRETEKAGTGLFYLSDGQKCQGGRRGKKTCWSDVIRFERQTDSSSRQ